jgi:WD40 repeat protein
VLQTLKGHLGSVNSIAFSPNSKLVVSRSKDWTIQLWDAATGNVLQTLKGYLGFVFLGFVNSVAFSLNGKQVVSRSKDRTVQL